MPWDNDLLRAHDALLSYNGAEQGAGKTEAP